MSDTIRSDGSGSISGKGTGAHRQTYRSTVGGTFMGVRLKWLIRTNPLGDFTEPFVYRLRIETDHHDNGAEGLLSKLGALITGHDLDILREHPVCFIFLHSDCTWAHIAGNQEGNRTDMVFIMHRDDPYSLLILENTDRGLKVIPQGSWQAVGGEIGKLAATWGLLNRPLYEDPANTAGSVTI